MTEIYLHFRCAHYRLSGNAPVYLLKSRRAEGDEPQAEPMHEEVRGGGERGQEMGRQEARSEMEGGPIGREEVQRVARRCKRKAHINCR